MYWAVRNHAAQFFGFFNLRMDKFLPAKSGIHGHNADQIDHIEQRRDGACGCAWVQGDARFASRGANGLHGAVAMRACFHMRGDNISACIGIGLNRSVYGRNHQMHIHNCFDMLADGGAERWPKCEVRYKMPIHHVYMYPIASLRLNRLDFAAKIGKICREY